MKQRMRWLLLLALGLALSSLANAQDEEASGEEEPPPEDEAAEAEEGAEEEEAEGEGEEGGDGGEGDPPEETPEDAEGESEDGEGAGEGDGGEEEGEECETGVEGGEEGEGDIDSILALGDVKKSCKKPSGGNGTEELEEDISGADALADALGAESCDKEGMDEKVASCLTSIETTVNELMTAVMGPDGGSGTLEDKITLVLVKKGVISCENETQCDDNKQCLKQPDGMSRCQNPCERPEIIRCDVPFAECITEDHKPMCVCKEDFHGNGTDVCIPMGFTTEDNKRGYRMFDEEYVEWENATRKCQELGARLPVLSDPDTIKIVKKYLETAEFEVFEQWDRSSRRVWLGLQYEPGAGLVWADGQRVASYPASSRLFVWESRRLLSQEVSYADNTRHYGFYIDGDVAKLPGGGRKGAAVLCELLPDQLAQDPNQQQAQQQPPPFPQPPAMPQPSRFNPQQPQYPGYPNRGGRYPSPNRYDEDGGYPNYPYPTSG